MDNWKRRLECLEYDSSVFKSLGVNDDVRTKKEIKKSEIEITQFGLVLSIARSILTRGHKYSPEVAAFARSYINRIPCLLNEKNGYLAINYENRNILRDFSKSTCYGEIAQGINYFFAKNYLGAYAIYDFKYYFDKNNTTGVKLTGRTPDYVLCYPGGKIGLIESKGTYKPNPTASLVDGHKQCDAGKGSLSKIGVLPSNSYSSVVSFATSSPRMKRNTIIYYADPETDIYKEDLSQTRNRLYEYSKWFYLMGNEEVTKKLQKGEFIKQSEVDLGRMADGGNIIIGDWDIDKELGKKTTRIRVGIKQSLLEYLVTGKEDVLENYEHIVLDDSEYFKDGTFMQLV